MAKVQVDRKVLCGGCNGKGGDKVEVCSGCKGKGVVMRVVQMGPGMYTQTQSHCEDC